MHRPKTGGRLSITTVILTFDALFGRPELNLNYYPHVGVCPALDELAGNGIALMVLGNEWTLREINFLLRQYDLRKYFDVEALDVLDHIKDECKHKGVVKELLANLLFRLDQNEGITHREMAFVCHDVRDLEIAREAGINRGTVLRNGRLLEDLPQNFPRDRMLSTMRGVPAWVAEQNQYPYLKLVVTN